MDYIKNMSNYYTVYETEENLRRVYDFLASLSVLSYKDVDLRIQGTKDFAQTYEIEQLEEFFENWVNVKPDVSNCNIEEVLNIFYALIIRYGVTKEEYIKWCDNNLERYKYIPKLLGGVNDSDAKELFLEDIEASQVKVSKEAFDNFVQKEYLAFDDGKSDLKLFDKYIAKTQIPNRLKEIFETCRKAGVSARLYFDRLVEQGNFDSIESAMANLPRMLNDTKFILFKECKPIICELEDEQKKKIKNEYDESINVNDYCDQLNSQHEEYYNEFENKQNLIINEVADEYDNPNVMAFGFGLSGYIASSIANAAIKNIHNGGVSLNARFQSAENIKNYNEKLNNLYLGKEAKTKFYIFISSMEVSITTILLRELEKITDEDYYNAKELERHYLLTKASMTKEEAKLKLCSILFSYPYVPSVYLFFAEEYFNTNTDLIRIADAFGIDMRYALNDAKYQCDVSSDLFMGERYPTISEKKAVDLLLAEKRTKDNRITFLSTFKTDNTDELKLALRFRIRFKALFDVYFGKNSGKNYAQYKVNRYVKKMKDRTLKYGLGCKIIGDDYVLYDSPAVLLTDRRVVIKTIDDMNVYYWLRDINEIYQSVVGFTIKGKNKNYYERYSLLDQQHIRKQIDDLTFLISVCLYNEDVQSTFLSPTEGIGSKYNEKDFRKALATVEKNIALSYGKEKKYDDERAFEEILIKAPDEAQVVPSDDSVSDIQNDSVSLTENDFNIFIDNETWNFCKRYPTVTAYYTFVYGDNFKTQRGITIGDSFNEVVTKYGDKNEIYYFDENSIQDEPIYRIGEMNNNTDVKAILDAKIRVEYTYNSFKILFYFDNKEMLVLIAYSNGVQTTQMPQQKPEVEAKNKQNQVEYCLNHEDFNLVDSRGEKENLIDLNYRNYYSCYISSDGFTTSRGIGFPSEIDEIISVYGRTAVESIQDPTQEKAYTHLHFFEGEWERDMKVAETFEITTKKIVYKYKENGSMYKLSFFFDMANNLQLICYDTFPEPHFLP
ncbi:hypothetical protein [Butyrivibrio sp. AE3004]|uniref:hypothetical protein n=1 Tax=Butyrivibrio sp. AE3004 TaxID=1506994 RepID=UPI0004948438|nr:hypothetical protein [Butyrivibrio sp. AE3004]